eukprot:s1379_g14.t10
MDLSQTLQGLWQRGLGLGSLCNSCTTFVVPETHRLARFGKKIRGKSEEKNLDFAASEASDMAQRSSDGINADGELTPSTRKTALEAMRNVLQRTEFTPRALAEEDGFGMEAQGEDDVTRKLHTRFLEAARSGNFRGVVEALSEGADLHCRTARGQTALMLAAACRGQSSLQIIGFLVECRVDVEAADHHGWTALLHACRNDMKEAAELLLKSQANVNAKSADGQNAAMLAAVESGDELVMRLVGFRVGLERSDRRGYTLLFYAVETGREDLVKWLLKTRSNPNARSKDKSTCTILAAEKGHLKILKALVAKNVDVNAQDLMGNNALLLSVMAARDNVARYLLNNGADCNVKNKDGTTALEVAAKLKLGPLKSLLDVMSRKTQDRGLVHEEQHLPRDGTEIGAVSRRQRLHPMLRSVSPLAAPLVFAGWAKTSASGRRALARLPFAFGKPRERRSFGMVRSRVKDDQDDGLQDGRVGLHFFSDANFTPLRSLADDRIELRETFVEDLGVIKQRTAGGVPVYKFKTKLLLEALEEAAPEEVFLISDVDIQFFGEILPLVKEGIAGRDLCLQREFTNLGVNIGFMAIRRTAASMKFWQSVWDELPTGRHDQRIVNNLLYAAQVPGMRWGCFPPAVWASSQAFDGNGVPEQIILHHANWVVRDYHAGPEGGADASNPLAKLQQLRQLREAVQGEDDGAKLDFFRGISLDPDLADYHQRTYGDLRYGPEWTALPVGHPARPGGTRRRVRSAKAGLPEAWEADYSFAPQRAHGAGLPPSQPLGMAAVRFRKKSTSLRDRGSALDAAMRKRPDIEC